MKWYFSAPLVALLIVSAVGAQDKMKETPWYPLQVGNTWTYKDSAGQRIVLKVAKHEKVDATMTARIEMLSPDNKVLNSENIGVTDKGVFRYRFGDQKPDEPVQILTASPKKGDQWKINVKALKETLVGTFKIEEQEIKVPAGTYKTVAVISEDLTAADVKTPCTQWYAEGVGLVKTTVKVNGQEITLELEKFEPGKK
jgi:hypothetical protein